MAKPPVSITIDRNALRANIAHAKATFAADTSLMIAVKSNAYGLGASLIVPEVIDAGADELAVLDIPTAVATRALSPHTPVFAWLLGPHDDYRAAAEAGVELGVSTLWQLDAIADTQSEQPVVVHLKIDTGLHRNGATAKQWPELVARARELQDLGRIQVRAIWSHLADTSVEESKKALARLNDAIDVARSLGVNAPIAHLAASHAAVELPETRLDMVRLGILAYGVSPFDDHTAPELGFQPVLTVTAQITARRSQELEMGMGFAHGLLQPSADAWVRSGERRLRVGEVGPETTVLYPLDSDKDLPPGDTVEIIGTDPRSPQVEDWASWCSTIGDEIVAKLHPEIPRAFV